MSEQPNIPLNIRRRYHLIGMVLYDLLKHIYPCEYNSSDHFVEGVMDELFYYIGNQPEFNGLDLMTVNDFILEHKYDELTDFFNEHCIVLKNDYLQEHIRKVLREETEVEKQPSIKVYNYKKYTLILSKNPCDIFTHFKVKDLHGLNYQKCLSFKNTKDNAYIAGLTNLSPKTKKHFLFLNTSRLGKGKERMGLIMHETMHLSLELHKHDVRHKEEDIITWAENEAYKIYDILETK